MLQNGQCQLTPVGKAACSGMYVNCSKPIGLYKNCGGPLLNSKGNFL